MFLLFILLYQYILLFSSYKNTFDKQIAPIISGIVESPYAPDVAIQTKKAIFIKKQIILSSLLAKNFIFPLVYFYLTKTLLNCCVHLTNVVHLLSCFSEGAPTYVHVDLSPPSKSLTVSSTFPLKGISTVLPSEDL